MDTALIKVAKANGLTKEEAVFLVEQGLEKLSWRAAPETLTPYLKKIFYKEQAEELIDKTEALTRAYIKAGRHGLIDESGKINSTISFGSKPPKKNNNNNNNNKKQWA